MSAPWAKVVAPEDPLDKPARKRIRSVGDVAKWQKMASFEELTGFLVGLGDSVKGVSNDEGRKIEAGPALKKLMEVMDVARGWVAEIPLQDLRQQRYGNKAFKEWWGRLSEKSEEHMREILQAGGSDVTKAAELAVYWKDAFGNEIRIDYGTGHELNFATLLFCLAKLDALLPTDHIPLVTQVFTQYVALMRLLQSHYSMEPAGSKGVWGLDDYHHLIFYWGACQLLPSTEFLPHNIKEKCKENRDSYLYLEGLSWILDNKSGSFAENSPTLASLAELQWPKIQKGMLKMYHGEVLGQWPVVQHLCFGSILKWEE
eukprot:TRINITY_DN3247_c0_g1_i1.p1 TRINITY_DN3247_c0_g1~~TRINITY_DN3247_c0_g1_i1.p1  ORF type:complete len:315 (+),score=65.49 TRINITY_DN3247_c0_g1_i1:68-1012(+)